MDNIAKQIEQVLKTVPGTSSAYAERGIGGYYLDVTPDREALARYGIMVQDVQDVIATALGGQTVTTTVEGRQRFTVNMRYPRDLRDNPQSIANDVLVPMPLGGAVPLGEVARIAPARGPTSIRTGWPTTSTSIRGRDLGGYVADAQRAVQASQSTPLNGSVPVQEPAE
jgi:Cu(I)/Ag(I) efflux system membrane protein CusA/SilA